MQLRRSQARGLSEWKEMQSEEQLIQRRKPLEAIMANHKISDRIESLLIRNKDVPEDVARQLRTQMTTMFKLCNGGTLVGSPQVTFAQLGVEIAIAQKTGDAGCVVVCVSDASRQPVLLRLFGTTWTRAAVASAVPSLASV
jgi:hypothetical protein